MDGKISASSQYNAVHAPKRVRIDGYFGTPCGWAAKHSYSISYIQVDFPQNMVVLGILIRARCVNLIVIKGRFSFREGGIVDLVRFSRKYARKHRVVNRGGRVDFYSLRYVVSVTSRGYLTIYLTVSIASVLEQIEDKIQRIGEACLPFSSHCGFSA